MTRLWTGLPLVMMAAVPMWTGPSGLVLVLEGLAVAICLFGILGSAQGAVTAGASVGVIGYAIALGAGVNGIDVVGAALFGLALLFLFDLSDFSRRFRGADIAGDVLRAQTAYWLGRAAIVAGATAVLGLGGYALSALVPGGAHAVIAGLGAVLAFAGALRAGIIRKPGDV